VGPERAMYPHQCFTTAPTTCPSSTTRSQRPRSPSPTTPSYRTDAALYWRKQASLNHRPYELTQPHFQAAVSLLGPAAAPVKKYLALASGEISDFQNFHVIGRGLWPYHCQHAEGGHSLGSTVSTEARPAGRTPGCSPQGAAP